MKGIIFTNFLKMVEENYGYATVDQLLTESDLPSKGIYTAVGTYDHQEMHTLANALGHLKEKETADLYYAFGTYFFSVFEQHYGHFLEGQPDAFTFLESLEGYIHVEVKKLYPEAELPQFLTQRLSPNSLEMIYISERRMSAFAKGLIERCFAYYQEEAAIEMIPLDETGKRVKFVLTKHPS
ncbi:MAG: heme NO-binding domain-containing protein [Bacteroidota bacterium]